MFTFSSDRIREFVSRQMKNYISEMESTNYGDWEIEIFNKDVVNVFKCAIAKKFYISRNFYIDNDKVVLDNIEYMCSNDSLRIKYIQKNSAVNCGKKIAKKIMNLNSKMEYRNNSGVFYLKYLFPLLSVYAACFGYYCIHGSLLHIDDRNIVLTGLDGVGKSTLANLLSSDGGDILADNIVLFNGKTALNLNIAMRIDLDKESKYKTIYKSKEFKEILPDVVELDEVEVDGIYNLIRDRKQKVATVENIVGCESIWSLFLNTAPEIGQANKLLAPWGYLHSCGKKNDMSNYISLINLYIPENGITEAKEIIKHGC